MRRQLIRVIQWVRKFVKEKFHSTNPDLPYYITILLAAVIFLVTISAFIEITEDLTEDKLNPFDTAITEFVIGLRSDWLTGFLTFITHLGDRYAYIIITTLLAIFLFLKFRNWKFAAQTVSVLLLSTLSNIAIKRVINRQRPVLEHLVEVNTLSFPSGHSMSAMAFYGFLVYLCLRYSMTKWIRILLVTMLIGIIAGIGLSRIYLGVHFPSDVAAGFLGGAIWVSFSVLVFNVVDLLRKKKKNDQEPQVN